MQATVFFLFVYGLVNERVCECVCEVCRHTFSYKHTTGFSYCPTRSNFTCKFMATGGGKLDFGSKVRSYLASRMRNFVGLIQAEFYDRPLSKFTCKLLIMRGGTVFILGHWVKDRGQL